MRARIGTSGFAYKEWKGTFYPDNLPAARMLAFYASRFDTVEINNTFYKMPTEGLVAGWSAETPDSFAFVLKAPQRITHILRLKNAEDATSRFLQVAASLGNKSGPLLFQLPPNFKKDTAKLAEFLALLPEGVRCAFEFRHESWHSDDVYDALSARRVALCIAESDERTTPIVATAPWGYLRLREVEYSAAQLEQWVRKICDRGWGEAWIFFKHEDSGTGPRLAAELGRLLASA